jgi:GntR family transcriptional repressor for pyruvate dehydrogenase complex
MSTGPAPIEFEQIRAETAYRKVAEALMERILNRSLNDGDRLPSETELARQFGVNRSTVREAVR